MLVTVKIITDSTAYLARETLKELDITEISLGVNFEDQSFKEIEITNSEFYALMEKSPKIPTSSQPSPADFYEAFARIVEKGDQVAGIFLSTDLSGTYYSAVTARGMILEKYPEARIELIDSRIATSTAGYGAIAGAKAARAGLPLEQIVAIMKEVVNKGKLYFVPKNLEYLKKGGRIGGAAALLGTLLQVKPILTVIDGKVAVYDKVRTSEKATARLIDILVQDHRQIGVPEATVLHINCLEEARKVAERIAELSGLKAEIASMGPVIGLHVGPGTLGLAYYTE